MRSHGEKRPRVEKITAKNNAAEIKTDGKGRTNFLFKLFARIKYDNSFAKDNV